ncbi:MAG TPA: polyribonucleotide nucleotidyltransferase [Candidatus Paceibacterota bacterium]|jgi:polyribonucleotide nucleotidyltransferase|nr:polyribonucleotide nucleotidyltransferase [Parcubacteria group bacterium]MDP6119772.1 polyribonucleotide nucleotidyltransferase [Candidatus Paceibacterota bacterium]HJN62738.1 polyribonucleotide nucleotidyltransferase [Candidatus Paceibacterota bacterium]|tara:strand:- start:6820 stop:8970 length:2151 start_codon:yes stop_codon:yes gene_type:complete
MNQKEYSVEIGGKTITAQFSDMSDQAHGSVILRMGNTAVLATAVMSEEKKEGINWFPLTVDYEERFYAAGQILGSRFVRREGRPSEEAVLSARAVDRTVRPLFNSEIRNEIQVVITILSIDKDDPDILAVNATSLALATSDIPWNGPVSAVRIGTKNGEEEFIVNPTYPERDNAHFDMIACGKDDNINMIEVGGKEVSENFTTDALKKASQEIEKLQEWQKKIVSEIGKEKRKIEIEKINKEVITFFEKEIEPKLDGVIFSGVKGKIWTLEKEWIKLAEEKFPEENIHLATNYYEERVDEVLHKEALENNRRADGRAMDEVRPISAKVAHISPIIHGSGLFYRGGTHILSVLTLGGPEDAQLIEGMEERLDKRFFHHYNFPPFSVGETGRVGGFNRRMIGHGALAEKAIKPVIPDTEKFPYTIRIVSEAMASNGSTSMGSVCGSTLALMDGGVPIKAPVAGIASGLMMDEKGNYKILTDIQGPEDHHGDMDFKVAGTKDGITAIQMDVKVDGVPIPILKEALEAAKNARLHILDVMLKEIPEPRENISPNAPEVVMIKIKPDQIGLVIGSGGKTINDIKDKTGAEITIEDDGSVFITGREGGGQKAQEIIESMTHEYKAGEKFDGEVVKVLDFGAFVRINPWAEGLVHVSEIAPFRINNVADFLKEGDKVPVVVKEVDDRGRVNLSIKAVNPELFKGMESKGSSNNNHGGGKTRKR